MLILPELLNKLQDGHMGITKAAEGHRESCSDIASLTNKVKFCAVCVQNAMYNHEPLIQSKFSSYPPQQASTDL